MILTKPIRVYVAPARTHGCALKYRLVVNSVTNGHEGGDYYNRINELSRRLEKWKGQVIVADDLGYTRLGFDSFEDMIVLFTHITNGGEI